MSEQDDDKDLFLKHMSGVKPLKKLKTIAPETAKKHIKRTIPKRSNEQFTTQAQQHNIDQSLPIIEHKLQKPKRFREGVSVHANFIHEEVVTSDAILSFNLDNLAGNQQQKLVKGLISPHARIDLHGLERFEAQERLERFLNHAHQNQNRYLLVIHGKGGKHGETPILKQHLYNYLRQHPKILCLHSAHPKHGGTGALYVVLKKTKTNIG